MMQVTSRITINAANINMLNDLAKQALWMTADKLKTEVQQAEVVPRDKGTLQGEGMSVEPPNPTQIVNGVVSIVHSTVYARRLYFHPEYNFHREQWFDSKGKKHEGNANAQGEWFEPWISGENKDFCHDTFIRIYRRLLRGAS